MTVEPEDYLSQLDGSGLQCFARVGERTAEPILLPTFAYQLQIELDRYDLIEDRGKPV